MFRSRYVFSLGCALLLSAATLARPASSAGAAPTIGFEVPSVVDPIHTNGEPDIGIDPHGRVFVSGPTGTGTQRSLWYSSVDRGHTYHVISPGPPPSPIAGTNAPPGGGDTDINFDRSGKQYFADLYALICLRTATTSDGGATVSQSIYPAGCAGVPGADRQWLAIYDPAAGTPNQSAYTGPRPLIYMEYNNINTGAQWVKSNSAVDPLPGGPGLTFVNAETNGPGDVTQYSPFGADGYPSIDQVTGDVFQANFSGTSILLNIGTPDASGNLTFLDAPDAGNPFGDPSKLITAAANVPDSANDSANFVVTSMDSARNLYVAWVGKSTTPSQRQTFVSVASAASGWKQWSAPVQVSQPPSLVSVFPWVKAGGSGRADVVWYGSNLSVDPSSPSGQSWDVFMSQVVYPTDGSGAVTGAAPRVTMVKVTPHPMHYNDLCLGGSGCIAQQGNRNLADFFDITIDKTGAAEIVYDDTSNGLVQPGFTPTGNQTVDHAGAPVVTVARQSSGPGLLGTNVYGASNAPTSGITDSFGDALYPVIGGTNVPGMDILSNAMSLSGSTLTVTTKVVDLSNPAATAARIPGAAFLQYVSRWQMGNTIYYAAMETTAQNQPAFFAGKAQSVDLCSVSACFPHVITYPEPGFGGSNETGTVSCPNSPSASNPCTLTIKVNVADVGNPTNSILLEEVGGYSLASAHQQGALTNAQAQADDVPLEVDGACCYNTRPPATASPPCHEGDGNGSIHGKDSGTATFSFDEDSCENQDVESEQFDDPGSGTDFRSTQISAVTFDDVANTVTIVGTGTDNGIPVAFTIVGVDNGPSLPGVFSITLSDGYSNTGTLLSGSIQLY
jgi:hypothetical protein